MPSNTTWSLDYDQDLVTHAIVTRLRSNKPVNSFFYFFYPLKASVSTENEPSSI